MEKAVFEALVAGIDSFQNARHEFMRIKMKKEQTSYLAKSVSMTKIIGMLVAVQVRNSTSAHKPVAIS